MAISGRADAAGLASARAAGMPAGVAVSKGFAGDRTDYDAIIMYLLRRYGVTPESGLVCLAGFMRILSAKFIDTYPNPVTNIRPSLLPSFGRLDAQEQALKRGAKCSGCTVRFADADVDTGPVICRTSVPVCHTDTDKVLAARILKKSTSRMSGQSAYLCRVGLRSWVESFTYLMPAKSRMLSSCDISQLMKPFYVL